MLAVQKPRRKRSARDPFLVPLWADDHPALRRIDPTLPSDHHARWLVRVISHLDLTAFRLSYAGYGSLAYPVELLLAFATGATVGAVAENGGRALGSPQRAKASAAR